MPSSQETTSGVDSANFSMMTWHITAARHNTSHFGPRYCNDMFTSCFMDLRWNASSPCARSTKAALRASTSAHSIAHCPQFCNWLLYFTFLFYCTVSWYITVCRCLQMFAASLLSMHYHAFTCFCSVAPLRSQPLRSQRISRGLAWECVRFCSKVLRKGKQIQKCVLFTVVPCLESNWRDKKRSTKTVCLGYRLH
jgi:hypothetical protein